MVATQCNSTPLCPTSFTEEGAVMLCIGLGQEHPQGVLWLWDTKAVLAFWCNSNMLATMYHLTVAMVWHNKPIKLHILPLKSRQVKEYVAMRGSYPSGI